MVVLFRFLLALFKSRFRRRLGVLDDCVIAMRVWPNDLDLNMHMNSGRYLSMMDIGRVEILARTRLLRRVLGRGWRPMVGATFIRYHRSLLPFERFTVRSRIVCWDEKWLYFEHILERRGEVAAHAYVRGLLRGRDGNVRPKELLELAGRPELVSPPMPEAVEAWRKIIDPQMTQMERR
ncbi:MAG TPA: acyl-CoA thioesterase [Thermoanaerobaculia bacterium]|nr:acyl-CoA thioesterase [Thermoanaerobaculia bacterium]